MKKVLLLDDDKECLESIAEYLQDDYGMRCEIFSDISLALKYIESHPASIALAIVEIIIQGKISFEVIDKLREVSSPAFIQTPVIVMNEHMHSDYMGRIRKKLSAALAKPIQREALKEQVDEALLMSFLRKLVLLLDKISEQYSKVLDPKALEQVDLLRDLVIQRIDGLSDIQRSEIIHELKILLQLFTKKESSQLVEEQLKDIERCAENIATPELAIDRYMQTEESLTMGMMSKMQAKMQASLDKLKETYSSSSEILACLNAIQEQKNTSDKNYAVKEFLQRVFQEKKVYDDETLKLEEDLLNKQILTKLLGQGVSEKEITGFLEDEKSSFKSKYQQLLKRNLPNIKTTQTKNFLQNHLAMSHFRELRNYISQSVKPISTSAAEEVVKISQKYERSLQAKVYAQNEKVRQDFQNYQQEICQIAGMTEHIKVEVMRVKSLFFKMDDQPTSVKKENPLMLASLHGDIESVKAQIAAGEPLEYRGSDGKNLLHYAAKSGSIELVDFLCEQGLKLKEADYAGNIAFFSAIKARQKKMVEHILDKLPHVQFTNKKGVNALMLAAEAGESDIFLKLIQKGLDPKSRDASYKSVYAYAKGAKRKNILQILTKLKITA